MTALNAVAELLAQDAEGTPAFGEAKARLAEATAREHQARADFEATAGGIADLGAQIDAGDATALTRTRLVTGFNALLREYQGLDAREGRPPRDAVSVQLGSRRAQVIGVAAIGSRAAYTLADGSVVGTDGEPFTPGPPAAPAPAALAPAALAPAAVDAGQHAPDPAPGVQGPPPIPAGQARLSRRELLARGWTSPQIKALLGAPAGYQEIARKDANGNPIQIMMWDASDVAAAEASPQFTVAPRSERKPRDRTPKPPATSKPPTEDGGTSPVFQAPPLGPAPTWTRRELLARGWTKWQIKTFLGDASGYQPTGTFDRDGTPRKVMFWNRDVVERGEANPAFRPLPPRSPEPPRAADQAPPAATAPAAAPVAQGPVPPPPPPPPPPAPEPRPTPAPVPEPEPAPRAGAGWFRRRR